MKTKVYNKDGLQIMDIENIFDVFQDDDGYLSYNLNQTLYFEGQEYNSQLYTLTHDMFWTTISYEIYGNTRLAWMLMKINGVNEKNLFSIVKAGSKIRYISRDTVSGLLEYLINGK